MAIVNVSLDTSSRQAVLTVDGVLVPASDISIEKYICDGEKVIGFRYTIESVGVDGMKEIRQFYLPSPEELSKEVCAGLSKEGFASKIIYNDEKAKADTVRFFMRNKKVS